MTEISLEYLMWFLNTYQPKPNARFADYGGTENIACNIVKNSLSAAGQNDYTALDFDNGIDLRKPIKGPKFDVGICMDLLEHTSDPFLVAKNIKNSLAKDALLFVTVPFVWEIHYYPKDYWRFTPQGIEELFSGEEMDHPMAIEMIGIVRDKGKNESLPRIRTVAVFRNSKKLKVPRADTPYGTAIVVQTENPDVVKLTPEQLPPGYMPPGWGKDLMGLLGPE